MVLKLKVLVEVEVEAFCGGVFCTGIHEIGVILYMKHDILICV